MYCFIHIDALKLYIPYHNSGWDFSSRDWDFYENLRLGLVLEMGLASCTTNFLREEPIKTKWSWPDC